MTETDFRQIFAHKDYLLKGALLAMLSKAEQPTGFPCVARDESDRVLSLDSLVLHPAATFFLRATGDGMVGAGIAPGDILVVDRAIEPKDRNLVVVVHQNAFWVRRLDLKSRPGSVGFVAEESAAETFWLAEEEAAETHIWGTVLYVVRRMAQ